jgi:hypothetical protein
VFIVDFRMSDTVRDFYDRFANQTAITLSPLRPAAGYNSGRATTTTAALGIPLRAD